MYINDNFKLNQAYNYAMLVSLKSNLKLIHFTISLKLEIIQEMNLNTIFHLEIQ